MLPASQHAALQTRAWLLAPGKRFRKVCGAEMGPFNAGGKNIHVHVFAHLMAGFVGQA